MAPMFAIASPLAQPISVLGQCFAGAQRPSADQALQPTTATGVGGGARAAAALERSAASVLGRRGCAGFDGAVGPQRITGFRRIRRTRAGGPPMTCQLISTPARPLRGQRAYQLLTGVWPASTASQVDDSRSLPRRISRGVDYRGEARFARVVLDVGGSSSRAIPSSASISPTKSAKWPGACPEGCRIDRASFAFSSVMAR